MHQDTRGRDQIFFQINNNKKTIEEICLGCGSLQVITQHPLFEGGLCDPCKDNFLETMFLYDQDGYQSFCTICCGGTKVLMCGNSGCKRCYCCECLDALVKPGAAKQAEAMEPWVCFMCCPVQSFGLLQKKKTWQLKLKQFFDQESDHVRIYAPVPTDKQNPIRVLSVFSNMTKDLQDIGILDRVHNANHETLTFLKDLDNVTRQNVEQKGPFDFVIGVCQQNSSVHHHSGRIIFQYYRILQYAKPKGADERPFFWIFVDPEILTQDDIKDASRFLECDPVIIHDFCESAVRLWSNIPSLKSLNTVQQINVSVQTLRHGIHHNSSSPPAWFHPLPALIGYFGDCSAIYIAVIGPAACKSWTVKFAADMYDPAWENRSQNSGETCMKMVKQFLVPLKDYFKSYL